MAGRGVSPSKILGIPLFVSIPLAILLLLVRGSRGTPEHLGPLWIVALFWYSILTSTYAVLLYKGMKDKLASLQLQAQGLLLTTLAVAMNAPPSLAWLGASLLIIGMILQGHAYSLPSGEETSKKKQAIPKGPSSEELLTSVVKSLVQNLSIPAFLTTLQGKILEKNEPFSSFLAKKELSAESLTALQRGAMDEDGVIHGPDKTLWTLGITPFEHIYLVCLEPFVLPQKETSGGGSFNPSPLNDLGIYVASYAPVRLKEELERVQRYRRILSVLLISVDLLSGSRAIFNEEKDRALTIFASILKHTMRTSDVGIQLASDKFLVLLPETNREGAKTFTKRLHDKIRHEAYEGEGQAAPLLAPTEELHLKFGFALASGNTPTTPEKILEEVEQFLQDSKEV